ncbi:MAG TPA: uroporphyrinogen decarboxylase [Bacteroidota bacterium]|nr:uroporphyrinogen decarboxylase [Bacteroidota bacterium]
MTDATNDYLISACYRRPTPRTPVWIMRQAGRYLPEYRAVRAKVDFLTLCRTPALAAEVTIQPVDIVGVDAAIIFSDILVVPEAMGMRLVVGEGRGGPRFPDRIDTRSAIEKLSVPDPHDRLRYVMDALSLTRRELRGRVPLIGFSGSPWTLAAYMVEGSGSREFARVMAMTRESRGDLHLLLEKLARSVTAYLLAQVGAGAQVLQIFDTWGGLLAGNDFDEFSLGYIASIVNDLPTDRVPVIVFCKDCGQAIEKIAATGCQTVGLDSATDIRAARETVGEVVSLQGNLEPAFLRSGTDTIRKKTAEILAGYGPGNGHIFNLGHGILPDIPVENVKELVRFVKSESARYHTGNVNHNGTSTKKGQNHGKKQESPHRRSQ